MPGPEIDIRRLAQEHAQGIGAGATLYGPTPQAENIAQQRQAEAMAAGPPRPTIGEVAAQTVGPVVGAALAPETLAAGVAARFGPKIISQGVQLLTRAGGAAAGGLALGEAFSPSGETPEEAARRRALDVAAGAGGEVLGAGLGAGTRAVPGAVGKFSSRLENLFAPLNPKRLPLLEPGAEAAQAALRPFGGSLMAGQMTQSWGIDVVQNIAEASFSGGPVIDYARRLNLSAAEAAVAATAPKVAQSVTPQMAGKLVQGLIERPLEAQKAFVRAAYNTLDSRMAAAGYGPAIDLSPIVGRFDKQFASYIEKGSAPILQMRRILNWDRPITFGEADDTVKMLGEIYRSRDPAVDPGLKANAGALIKQVNEAIDATGNRLGNAGQDIVLARDAARQARRTQAEFFNEELIGPLLEKAKPEEAAMALFQRNNPTQIESFRKIVYDPRFRAAIGGNPDDYWLQIQSSWFTQMKQEAGETSYGTFNARKAGAAMDHSNGTFEALFPNQADRTRLRTSVRAFELIQAKPGGTRSGSVLVQMGQGRDVGQIMGVGANYLTLGLSGYAARGMRPEDAVSAGLILMAPRYLAKTLASPHFSNWLMRRAISQDVRLGSMRTSIMAQAVSALIKDRIPFTFQDPSGATTSYDPNQGMQGQYARPSYKPTSKMKLPTGR